MIPILYQAIQPVAQAAPDGAWAPMLAAFAAGLVVWLMGNKVLRSAFAIIGGAAGGFAGLVLLPLTGLPDMQIGGITIGPDLVGMIIGGLIGLAVAVALFRFIITVGSAVVCAVAGVLAGLIWLSTAPADLNGADPRDVPPAETSIMDEMRARGDQLRDDIAQASRDLLEESATDAGAQAAGDAAATNLGEDARTNAEEQFRTAAEASRRFLSELGQVAQDEWDRRSPRERAVIFGSSALGFVVGLLLGALFTKRATAVITALAGSAVWLSTGLALLRGPVGLDPSTLSLQPKTWAVIWVAVAIIGLVLQFAVINKKQDERSSKPRNEDDDDED